MSKENEIQLNEEFEVIIKSTTPDGTEVVTSSAEIAEKMLASALAGYDSSNQKYSTYLKDGSSSSDKLTPEIIDELADGAQNDLKKILTINAIARKEINKDGIIGKTHECITTNINTEIRHSYNVEMPGRNKAKLLQSTKDFIDWFDNEINVKRLIRTSTPTAFDEGTYICYLRHENNRYMTVI